MYYLILLLSALFHSEPDLSSAQAKYTLYIFKGSDWCSNCKRFEIKVTADSSFENTLLKEGIQLKELDFPQKIKLKPEQVNYNDSIATALGFNGDFPGFILLNHSNQKKDVIYYKNESSIEFCSIVLSSKKSIQ